MSIESKNEVEVEPLTSTEVEDTAEILQDAKEIEANDPKSNESVEESIAEVLKDIGKEKSDGNEDPKEEKVDQEVDKPKLELKEKSAPQEKKSSKSEPEEPLYAPERFSLENKQAFNRLPADLKKEVQRMVKDTEGAMTRATQEAARARDESKYLREVAEPYAKEFGRLGMTLPQGIASLLSAHAALTDPKTSKQAYVALGKDLGFDVSGLETEEGQASLSNHPDIISLKEENKRLREMIEPVHNGVIESKKQKDSALEDEIFTELNSVKFETDSSGKFVNPKLHDDAFLQAWNPLVSALVRTDPTVKTYREAGKKAYDLLTGRSSSQSNQTRIPQKNIAVSAAGSVRGRVIPASGGQSVSDTPITANETPEQSARIALEELRRGI